MNNQEIFEVADELKEAKDRKKELDAQTKEVNARITELDATLSDLMAESEVDKFSRNGNTFYLSSRLFASPVAGKKDHLVTELRKKGYGGIVTETVNANTLASFCKERMAENGDELPEWLTDCVSVFEKVSVGIRKG